MRLQSADPPLKINQPRIQLLDREECLANRNPGHRSRPQALSVFERRLDLSGQRSVVADLIGQVLHPRMLARTTHRFRRDRSIYHA